MASVYLICSADDWGFAQEHVLPPLPPLGFAHLVTGMPDDDTETAQALAARCTAVVALVPGRTSIAPALRDRIAAARRANRPMILVLRHVESAPAAGPENDARLAIDPALVGVPCVAVAENATGALDDLRLWLELAALLPQPADEADEVVEGAVRIEWRATVFSMLLADAVGRLDAQRSDALVSNFARHCAASDAPYPAEQATKDLAVLRRKRMFPLMRAYAAAALRSGTQGFQVRRQFAQALIELGDFDFAREVLDGIIAAAPDGHAEQYEARGLLGRLFKQLYVNAPDAHDSRAHLQTAIEQYGKVYLESAAHVWQGINAVTLLMRAANDGVERPMAESPHDLASAILATLDDRQTALEKAGDTLPYWDLATRVEALLAVGRVDDAAKALDVYLSHPGIDAFEVSATHRQFEEVLQLGKDPRTKPLLDRLWQAVQRYRTSGIMPVTAAGPAVADRRMLLGVADPEWDRGDVPGLTIHARMGNVLSISGTEETVRALLKDPLVVSMEDSRPAGPRDCARSLPFIRVPPDFQFQSGGTTYTEKGTGALVALIDDGIDVLHAAFLDDQHRSRIVGIWDQDDPTGPLPPGGTYGTYYDEAHIASLVGPNAGPSPVVPARLRNSAQHGTHVASIAAGHAINGSFYGGVAPDARILVVISGGTDATGYSASHVDALDFIDRFATERDLPVVVNVSQGMNAGAHDGKSLVEVAFDRFTLSGTKPGRAIVKSAGNEREKRGHAEMRLLPGETSDFQWTCQDAPWFKDRLELWWNSANEYRIRLRAPGGAVSDWITRTNQQLDGTLAGIRFSATFVRNYVDNGDSRLTLDLGNRFTDRPVGQVWTLEVEAISVKGDDNVIHAWIERRPTPPSSFVSTNASEKLTLSIPGTATSVITVAAIDARKPIKLGTFSSHGPTRDGRRKPDVSAPGVRVAAARAETLDGVHELDGTSMAAPHVAGAIALAFSKCRRSEQPLPAATQITKLLQQSTMNYTGTWTEGQGYGVIDVDAFLASF